MLTVSALDSGTFRYPGAQNSGSRLSGTLEPAKLWLPGTVSSDPEF